MPAYQPIEPPPEDADFGPTHDEITTELLTLTHDFFRQASIAGLDTFLDRLGFSAGPHDSTDTPT